MSLWSSPDWMTPSLMKSSQMLWSRSCSSTVLLFIGELLPGAFSDPSLAGGEHDRATLGIHGAHDAMAPRHVRGRTLELDALRREVGVGAVHVLHHEVEHGLLGRAGLAHALHRGHEP